MRPARPFEPPAGPAGGDAGARRDRPAVPPGARSRLRSTAPVASSRSSPSSIHSSGSQAASRRAPPSSPPGSSWRRALAAARQASDAAVGGTWAAPRRASPPQRRGPGTGPRSPPAVAPRRSGVPPSRCRPRCCGRCDWGPWAPASPPPWRLRPVPAAPPAPPRPVRPEPEPVRLEPAPGRPGRGGPPPRPPRRPSPWRFVSPGGPRRVVSPGRVERPERGVSPGRPGRLLPRPSVVRPSCCRESPSRPERAGRPCWPDRRGPPRPGSDGARPDRPDPLAPPPAPRAGGGPAPRRPRRPSSGPWPRELVGAMSTQGTGGHASTGVRQNAKKAAPEDGLLLEKSGGDLLSQAVSCQVPSALEGLTSVFGMGTGVTPPPWPPKSAVNSGPRH